MSPEPRILECDWLARQGHWDVARCCRSCHERQWDDSQEIDLGTPPWPGSVRLHLCCRAIEELVLEGSSVVERLAALANAHGPGQVLTLPVLGA